jgi:hydroxymethylglutaryl-CoA lyase
MSNQVKIVEVGPRDGVQSLRTLRALLQNGSIRLQSVIDLRVNMIRTLYGAGLRTIEAGSFVSPKAVPLMQGSAEVLRRVSDLENVSLPVLVPNVRGLQDALSAGAKDVAFFLSASDAYGVPNTCTTTEESFARLGAVMNDVRAHEQRTGAALPVRGYLSCVFGYKAPGDDNVTPELITALVKRMMDAGCYEVSLGDTFGIGRPDLVQDLMLSLTSTVDVSRLAAHFHDAGLGGENTQAFLDLGGRVIDSSISGLGGAVTRDSAPGNISTQETAVMAFMNSAETGVDLRALIEAGEKIPLAIAALNPTAAPAPSPI